MSLIWKKNEDSLNAVLEFKDFVQTIKFMEECVPAIEEINHHPEWKNVYNTLEIKLTTHDAGNVVTDKDRKLAARLEDIYCKYQ